MSCKKFATLGGILIWRSNGCMILIASDKNFSLFLRPPPCKVLSPELPPVSVMLRTLLLLSSTAMMLLTLIDWSSSAGQR
eukprot:4412187-Karenia_brevis.AAC.1